MHPETRSRSTLLPRALISNAAFSGLCGLTLLLAAGPVAGWLGPSADGFLRGLGAGLLGFAGGLVFLARSEAPPPALVLTATAADFAWVAGSAVLLVAYPDVLSRAGVWTVVVVALVVAVLGLAQLVGLRRVRG